MCFLVHPNFLGWFFRRTCCCHVGEINKGRPIHMASASKSHMTELGTHQKIKSSGNKHVYIIEHSHIVWHKYKQYDILCVYQYTMLIYIVLQYVRIYMYSPCKYHITKKKCWRLRSGDLAHRRYCTQCIHVQGTMIPYMYMHTMCNHYIWFVISLRNEQSLFQGESSLCGSKFLNVSLSKDF